AAGGESPTGRFLVASGTALNYIA
ncbi:MAG: hypothetical protein QOJ95_3733, partial [Mycobacterium sp.]|nr:hypothetical protein [Mycobacterium sp.]